MNTIDNCNCTQSCALRGKPYPHAPDGGDARIIAGAGPASQVHISSDAREDRARCWRVSQRILVCYLRSRTTRNPLA